VGQRGSCCGKSQTYQGAATKYEYPGSISQAGHVEYASEAGCWLAKDSEVRGKPLQLWRTHHRRTLRKTKTAGTTTITNHFTALCPGLHG